MAKDKNKPGAKALPSTSASLVIGDLKTEPDEHEPTPSLSKSGGDGEMRLSPNHTALLVGNSYTAELQLPKDFDADLDNVTFTHPAGWDVKAAVTSGVASGTFLIERAKQFNFGFKINGKKVASASYETRDA